MKITCSICLIATFGVTAALADADWGFISTAGSPDPVTAFDLADPGGSQQTLGSVDGNFNRGMDFNGPDSFYYFVSTDTLNDPGDRGLWFWNNNVNNQITTIPFSDSGDGDASLSNDGNRLFVTVDDGDGTAGDSLYVFGSLGGSATFTEIGETGLTQLIGLAMDPATGTLYGYDSSTEGLYKISTLDGSVELVGNSGISAGAIGGMDFNADGSTLLLAEGGDLFTINKDTGVAQAAGDVGLNTSALSFRVPEPTSATLLVIVGLFGMRRRQ